MIHPALSPGRARRRTRTVVAALAVVGLGAAGLTVSSPVTAAGARKAPHVCLTGHLTYTAPNPETTKKDQETPDHVPFATSRARGVNWQLRGSRTRTGKPVVLRSGQTSSRDGSFVACTRGKILHKASITFVSEHARLWRVIDPKKRTLHSFTQTARGRTVVNPASSKAAVTGRRDLGNVRVPALKVGAFKVIDTVNELFNAVGGPARGCFTAACKELTYTWNPSTTNGGWWNSWADTAADPIGEITLTRDLPDSRHAVLHEAGHWLMWQLYGGKTQPYSDETGSWIETRFPFVENCSPHYVGTRSSASCAWTEGFADAVAAYSLHDRSYVYPDGYRMPLAPAHGGGWAGGDETQGNIGASLLDIWRADGGIRPDYANFLKGQVSTFDGHRENQGLHGPVTFQDYIVNYRGTAFPAKKDATAHIIAAYGITY